VADITISAGPGKGGADQVSESQAVLGARRAEEHGTMGVCTVEISYCSSNRRLWAKFQVPGHRASYRAL